MVLLGVGALALVPFAVLWALTDPHAASSASQSVSRVTLPAPRRVARHRQHGRLDGRGVPHLGPIEGLVPSGVRSRIDRLLKVAGKRDAWSPTRVVFAQVSAFIAAGVVSVRVLAEGATPIRLLAVAVLGLLAIAFPALVLMRAANQRRDELRRDLANILDEVVVVVEAGVGFDAALARVARDSSSALAHELGRTMQDMELGLSRDDAFERLLDRTDVDDLRRFVRALQQAARLGAPLASVLRVQAAELRQRRRANAEEKAMKLGVKLTFPTVLCILPAMLAIVLGPAIISLVTSGLQ